MALPNGLIFLVVVAIWAAYFVQYWIRRRDHLATARSMDRFSESMRVLARRSPLPRSSLEAPAPRSYAVSPGRSMRPQVLVKRADVATSTSMMASHVAGSTNSAYAGNGSGPRPASVGRAAHDAPRVSTDRPVRPELSRRPSKGVPRRIRGLVLLGQLVAFLVVTGLAFVGVLVWWAPVLAILAVGCAVVWVGQGVRADHTARTMHGRNSSRRPSPARSARQGARGIVAATAAEAQPTSVDVVDEVEVAAAECAQPYGFEDPTPATSPAASSAGTRPAAVLVDEDDIPLTWDPRPVPRPTYTMKARADRPLPAPADVTPTPIGLDEDDDVRAVEPQRHTG